MGDLPEEIHLPYSRKARRANIAMDIGERLVRGPDRLDSVSNTPGGWVASFRLWKYRPWAGPKVMASVYRSSSGSQPSLIVRIAEWQFARCRVIAMRTGRFDGSTLSIALREPDRERVADRLHAVLQTIASLPIDGPAAGERDAPDADVLGLKRVTADVITRVEWYERISPELDTAWHDLWRVLESGTEVRVGLRAQYFTDPTLGARTGTSADNATITPYSDESPT